MWSNSLLTPPCHSSLCHSSIFPLLSLPPPPTSCSFVRLSLLYCWTIILVQTVKCIILYNFIEKITFRRSLCLDHDCTCKNELICKLCFTALYSWTGLCPTSSVLARPLRRRPGGEGHRIGAEAFRLLLSFHFFPTFVCSLIHLFCFDSPLVYIIGFEKRKNEEKKKIIRHTTLMLCSERYWTLTHFNIYKIYFRFYILYICTVHLYISPLWAVPQVSFAFCQ